MLLTLTLLLVLLYIACTNCTIHYSTLSFCMAHQMAFLGSQRNAFSREKKFNFLFLIRCFFCNCLRMSIASVVPQPSMKQNCMSSINTLSLIIFSITLSIPLKESLIEEFKTSLVTSYQSITFSFVDIDDNTIFLVKWDGVISYHVISKVSNQPYTRINGSLQHLSNGSQGSSSFAIFHLDNSFCHYLNSYEYGRANNSISSQVLRKRTLHSENVYSVVSKQPSSSIERLPESSLTHLSATTSWLSLLNCSEILRMPFIPGFRSENFFTSAVFFAV